MGSPVPEDARFNVELLADPRFTNRHVIASRRASRYALSMRRSSIDTLRQIGNTEGVSFLLLLGVAMPLKYGWDWPWGVKVLGWAHGVLFVALGLSLLRVWLEHRWSFFRVAMIFFAAFVPFGPFVVDKLWLKEGAGSARRAPHDD